MSLKIMIGGLGGQGVVTTGKLLGTAAVGLGRNATCFNEYAPTQRNGFAYSTVVISDDEVLSPVTKSFDCMVFLDELSCMTQSQNLVDNGIYILNSDLVGCKPAKENAATYCIPISKIANDLGNARFLNVIAIGAIIAATGVFSADEMSAIIRKRFGAKPRLAEINVKAMLAGVEAVRRQIA